MSHSAGVVGWCIKARTSGWWVEPTPHPRRRTAPSVCDCSSSARSVWGIKKPGESITTRDAWRRAPSSPAAPAGTLVSRAEGCSSAQCLTRREMRISSPRQRRSRTGGVRQKPQVVDQAGRRRCWRSASPVAPLPSLPPRRRRGPRGVRHPGGQREGQPHALRVDGDGVGLQPRRMADKPLRRLLGLREAQKPPVAVVGAADGRLKMREAAEVAQRRRQAAGLRVDGWLCGLRAWRRGWMLVGPVRPLPAWPLHAPRTGGRAPLQPRRGPTAECRTRCAGASPRRGRTRRRRPTAGTRTRRGPRPRCAQMCTTTHAFRHCSLESLKRRHAAGAPGQLPQDGRQRQGRQVWHCRSFIVSVLSSHLHECSTKAFLLMQESSVWNRKARAPRTSS